jgi:hypothetical protein
MVDVPVGGIIPFIGKVTSLGANWVVCKGQKITDRASPFNGQTLPNLTDERFLMGVASGSEVGKFGGTNIITEDLGGSVPIETGPANRIAGYEQLDGGSGGAPIPDTNHIHGGKATLPPHNHGGDKRPQWCAVVYICRIK